MKDKPIDHTSERENDVQEMCRQVLNATPMTHYDKDNYQDYISCPFCNERFTVGYYTDHYIDEIEHSPDCAYHIAKDLSTNLKQ